MIILVELLKLLYLRICCQWSFHFQPQKAPLEKALVPKSKATITYSSRAEVTGSLAPLFETQHPWSKDGGFENNLGGFGMGGVLGIRGGMPKLPSFKVHVL